MAQRNGQVIYGIQEAWKMGFVKDFVWGAATSAYQIEGGVYGTGKGDISGMCTQKSREECMEDTQVR